MSGLISGVLEYSRVGFSDQLYESIDAEQIVQSVLADLGATIEMAGARITHDVLPKLVGNRTQLAQVFQNLIGNAIKFRCDGVSPHVHVSCRPDADGWLFSIRDNGIGIEDQFHTKVFRMFQRLHRREQFEGTGIGLAICKKVVEAHGGRIWIEPYDGTGSTFCFTLSNNLEVVKSERSAAG